jgi:hypothetical protein
MRWTYEPEPKWGQDVATCTVTLGGRTERWQAKGIYVYGQQRESVPQQLAAKLRRTIRLFGTMETDDDD